MIERLAPNNSYDFVVSGFYRVSDDSVITDDETLAVNIYDSEDVLVAGPELLVSEGSGNYRATLTNLSVTPGSRYKVVISSTTYDAEWTAWIISGTRPFNQ